MQSISAAIRRSFALSAGFALCVADVSPAAAEPGLSRGAEELSHDVEVRIDGWIATVTTHQELTAVGDTAVAATYEYELPARAAITELSIASKGKKSVSLSVDPDAALRLSPDTDRDGAAPDLGVLELATIDEADGRRGYRLYLPRIPAKTSLSVRTTWVAPVDYQDGALRFRIPGRSDGARLARERVTLAITAPTGATGFDAVTGAGHTLALKTGARATGLEVAALPGRDIVIEATPRFSAAAPVLEVASAPLAKGHAVAISLVVPPPSVRDPAEYEHIVLAIDVSRSMETAGVAAAADIVGAILTAADPASRVEVVVFDRTARRVLGRFAENSAETRGTIRDALDAAPLANGSDLGAALDAVREVIEATPVGATSADLAVSRGERPPTLLAVIGDGLVPVSLSADDAVARLGGLALAETQVVAITVVPADAPIPDHRKGPLEALIARSGGKALAIRHAEAKARGAEVLVELGTPPALQLTSISRTADDVLRALPESLGSGEGAIAFAWTTDPPPARLELLASIADQPLTVRARRARGGLARAARPLAAALAAGVGRARDDDAGDVRDARALASIAQRAGIVSARSSLVAVDARDSFARDRIALVKKWGGAQFSRVASDVDANPEPVAIEIVDIKPSASPRTAFRPTGDIDRFTVQRLIRAHVLPPARACYQKAIRRARSLEGELTTVIEMARGEVQHVRIESSSLADAAVAACVIDAAYEIPIPTVGRGDALELTYIARYPIRFRIKDAKGVVGLGSDTDPDADGGALKPSRDPTDPLDGVPRQ